MLIIFVTLRSFGQQSYTEEFRLKGKAGEFLKITVFNAPNIVVEGYAGSDIIMQSSLISEASLNNIKTIDQNNALEVPVTPVINPSIQKQAETIYLIFKGEKQKRYVLKLPKKQHVSITQQTADRGGSLLIKGMSNEIEIRTDAAYIKIDSISGPCILNARSMSSQPRKIILSKLLRSSWKDSKLINILSFNHDIELEVGTKPLINFDVATPHGDVYSNIDLKRNNEKISIPGRFKSATRKGLLAVKIRTEYGNVFLKN